MPPESWQVLLDGIRTFIDPVVEDIKGHLIEWDPAMHTWTRASS
jgi:hypothetical protein